MTKAMIVLQRTLSGAGGASALLEAALTLAQPYTLASDGEGNHTLTIYTHMIADIDGDSDTTSSDTIH